MDDKIKRLTDKILAEGVEKGKQRAEELLNEATRQSEEKVVAAQEEAQKLVANAHKQVGELKKNAEGELKLAAEQTIQSVKSAIADDLSEKLSQLATSRITQDPNFFHNLILKIVGGWNMNEGLTIETEDADALTNFFKANAKELLDKGINIEKVAGRKTSVTLKPANGSYKVNFGEEELKQFFQSFLRPQLIDLLFK